MDIIELIGLEFYGFHGLHEIERKNGQTFIFDVYIYVDLENISINDDITDTIDYSNVYNSIKLMNEENKFILIETLGEYIAKTILENYKKVEKVKVKVKKKKPPIDGKYDYFGVVITRGRT